MNKILVIIEKGTDGLFSAYTPETKSTVLNGQGNTVAEAIADMKESFQEVIESYQETEETIPEELQEPVVFEFVQAIHQLFFVVKYRLIRRGLSGSPKN